MARNRGLGFTLAELLIALAILGIIATFTIPKLLAMQANARFNAAGKEAASMITGAFVQAQQAGQISASTTGLALIPYLNYVSIDTTSLIDDVPGVINQQCWAARQCLRLHGGGTLMVIGHSFTGTGNQNALDFIFDPDGLPSGTTNGQGKSIEFMLYYNGFLTTLGNVKAGTCNSAACPYTASPDPDWFSWQQ